MLSDTETKIKITNGKVHRRVERHIFNNKLMLYHHAGKIGALKAPRITVESAGPNQNNSFCMETETFGKNSPLPCSPDCRGDSLWRNSPIRSPKDADGLGVFLSNSVFHFLFSIMETHENSRFAKLSLIKKK